MAAKKEPLTTIVVENFGVNDFAIRHIKPGAEDIYECGLDINDCFGTLARLLVVSNEIRMHGMSVTRKPKVTRRTA
jgi:hypothetical protein